jgi:hypothetical protein
MVDPAHEVRDGSDLDPRGRGQGCGDRRAHVRLQDPRVRRKCGPGGRCRRRLRVLPHVHRSPWDVRHPRQRSDRAGVPARRARHALGTGSRRVRDHPPQ